MFMHPNRRSFLAGCGAALTASLFGRVSKANDSSKAVAVIGRAGELFPPLALSQKMVRANQKTDSYVVVQKSARGEAEILDIAVFPDVAGESGVGLLAPKDLVALKPMIHRLLVREFGYTARSIDLIRPAGFWYPFNDHGTICCRLVITPVGEG